MKKRISILFVSIFLLTSCMSIASVWVPTTWESGTLANSLGFTLLGEITVAVRSNTDLNRNGFRAFVLSEVKKQYPDADDLIDVVVSTRYTYSMGSAGSISSIVVEAKVIKYNKRP